MASSSSSLPFDEPTFSSQLWKYHVFLSFRGEDTRKTFVDHLYTALTQQGIYTYKDDRTLPRGESIGTSLMKAIEESQIAVVIFSKNYANSSWCLNELAYIMKCKDTRGQIVLPIFYDVDPSVVRKQKQKYGEALAKHELENNNDVESWKIALVEASNLSGWEPRNIANGHESMAIKEIVDTISHRLHSPTSSANENLIGIEARMQDLKSKLEIGSGGVRMIGIWGVGGGGKTTLAFSVYCEICNKFDGCCFVENIREESRRYGLERLQDKILSNVLKQKEIEVNGFGGGRWLINNRLRHRKVLIVLDDVDHLDQLKALAGSHCWFGEGSRIIIATRNKHLLTAHRVDMIHNISLLNNDEAIKLFCKHTPLDHKPPMEDYDQLSKDVVSYAGGLPLALTTLGSFLCDKSVDEWKSALARLKEIPDTDIVEKLKISFYGLKPIEKELFLDIACFFRREDKDEAMKVLHACGLHPVIGVKVLIEKALITISNGMFDMHDLVQEMGHYVVRGEHPNNPEKHSRLWKKEDVLKICAMDAETELDVIEAIRFKCSTADPLQRLPLIVANMKNLKRINWEGDLTRPLPTNFSPKKLCCLKLEGISQKLLWEGYKYLPNLRIMELYGLRNLIMTPNFDGLPNLERFKLTECWYIEEIHSSIGRLENLVFLAIEGCMRLKIFPPITRPNKLETLQFSGCPQLFKLSKIQKDLDSLPHLQRSNSRKEVESYMKYCTNFFVSWWRCGRSNIRGYTETSEQQANLIDVEDYCLEEPCLPYNINHIIGLQRGLKKLNLSFCKLVDEVISSAAVWDLPNLEELDLTSNKFSRLNFSLLQLSRLKRLNVSRCGKLVELSKLPSSIAVVIADDCKSLETLGDISNCKWLWKLSVRGRNKLGAITDTIIDCMFKGNAIEHHFISVSLQDEATPHSFLGRLYRRETFTLHLPSDWYTDFSGLLVRIATKIKYPNINIVIKQEAEVSKQVQHDHFVTYDLEPILIGYVSFGSLMHTTSLNSSYNTISISLDSMYWTGSCVGAELVPRKSKSSDEVQTTGCSEFWENEKTFMIEHDSKSSIEIRWHSYVCT